MRHRDYESELRREILGLIVWGAVLVGLLVWGLPWR